MNHKKILNPNGQAMVEYILLLAAVVAIVLVGFKTYLPRTYNASSVYFNKTQGAILGEPNPCGDGCKSAFETCETCPMDCNAPTCPTRP